VRPGEEKALVVVVIQRQRGRGRGGRWRKTEKGTGIARVNALSRCWSCLITSYQLKGKRREGAREGARATVNRGKKRETKSDYGQSCEAFDCGDSEFLAELHHSFYPRSPSFSLARSLFLPCRAIRLMKADKVAIDSAISAA